MSNFVKFALALLILSCAENLISSVHAQGKTKATITNDFTALADVLGVTDTDPIDGGTDFTNDTIPWGALKDIPGSGKADIHGHFSSSLAGGGFEVESYLFARVEGDVGPGTRLADVGTLIPSATLVFSNDGHRPRFMKLKADLLIDPRSQGAGNTPTTFGTVLVDFRQMAFPPSGGDISLGDDGTATRNLVLMPGDEITVVIALSATVDMDDDGGLGYSTARLRGKVTMTPSR